MSRRARVEDIYPLTPLQAGFFFHHTMAPEDDPYVPQLCIDLGPELDIVALERATQELASRHAILRTSVHVRKDGEPLQVVHASVDVPFERLDEPVADDRFDAWLEDNRRRGFDLRRAPLSRMTLIPRDEGWRLVWTTHHFVMDGWSHRLLLRELSELYRAAVDGKEAALAPAPKFKAFIAWLKQRDPSASMGFWKRALAGFSEITPLGGRPRAATSTPRWVRHEHLVSRALTSQIEAFSRANRITLATLVDAAWALVMSRYSGRREVVFGVTVSGRSAQIPNIETTTGPFINTVPLRIALPRIRVDEWLQRLQAQMHETRAHEHVPLTEIQQVVAGGRPIFDTLLVVENHLSSEGAERALPIRGVRFHDHSHYPLTVWVHPGEELSLRVEYDDERYAGTAIPNAMRHLECALANLVRQSARTLDEIEIVPDDERHKLLVMWNETRVPVDTDRCIHEPFEAQVDRAPDAIALVSDDGERSYGAIERDANRLAHRLVELGVRPGMFVGVLLERSPEMIVTLLAIMKVGGAYLPLDPKYPKDRLEYLVADMRAEVVVTERQYRDSATSARSIVLDDEADAAAIARCSSERLEKRVTADCFAYVIYTSGSTGKPKGVLVTHRPVMNLIDWVNRTYEVGPRDRLLFVASLSFDLSVYDVFGMLAAGGSIRIVKGADLKEPSRLFGILASEPITFWDSAPAMLQSVATAFPAESLPDAPLRLVFLSGDWIPVKLPDAIRHVFTRARVISLGGATEATVWSNHYPIGRVDPSWPSIPYGVPMQNARYHVLDQRLQPCPVGVTGDLYIAGDCLSTGYANAPELTAWKYIPDPFSDRPGARMYRTGDLARYFADGNLEFCGRADTQVKIRGYRIELGEIEGALQEHPEVRDAVVLAREDVPGDKRLVAYLVAKERGSLEIADVREHARQRLPEYMIPAALVMLDQLPLTANGKVDRKQLPAPEIAAPRAWAGPRTPVEEAIAEIWQEVLGVPRVGIHDDFFELGGHSLLATQLAARIRQTLNVELPLRTLIEAPTIAGVAEVLASSREGGAEAVALPEIVPSPDDRYLPFPLSDVQQAYWVGRRDDFDLGGIGTQLYVEFEGADVDLARLERSLQLLVERHDTLRAVILPDARQQVLRDVPPYRIETLDLADLAEEEANDRLGAVRRRMSEEARDPSRWPLFEVRASIFAPRRVRLHVAVDMLLFDAWSLNIFFSEWATLYHELASRSAKLGASSGEGRGVGGGAHDDDVPLPRLELAFRDYVLAEAALRKTPLYERSLQYWKGRLPTLPPRPELPLARQSSSLTKPRFVRRVLTLPPERWRKMKTLATRHGVTAPVMLVSAFAEVLAAWSKDARFTINLTLFNRLPMHPQVSEVIGDFTSLTMLAVDGEGASFHERARRIQLQLWSDLEHRYVSGVQVLRELARTDRGGGAALAMPVVFTSALAMGGGTNRDAFPARFAFAAGQTSQVWLDHQVVERDGALRSVWDSVDDLFPPSLVDAMFEAYSGMIDRLVDDEESWKKASPGLLPAIQLERRNRVNATSSEYPRDKRLQELFDEQVRVRPDDLAVVSGARTMTYAELQRRARGVARWLRAREVRPNELVAVSMEKGIEQIVAVFGVLYSGAAYVPIDPDLPRERIAYLLGNTETKQVLTQSWLSEKLPDVAGVELLHVDSDLDALGAGEERETDASRPIDDAAPLQRPEDLAYVIFTSGSTGQPKGVMIEHRAAVNTILDINQRFGVRAGDRVLALSSLSFDLSVYDVFGTLAAGGTIVLPEASGAKEVAHWADLMVRERVTVWNSVPALLELLVEHVEVSATTAAWSLRLAMLSGDWIPLSLPDRVKARVSDVDVVSLGGATEAAIWSIYFPIDEVDPSWRSIPYGRPLANQTFFVLDRALEPRPDWVPGDLYIGGEGLARGYWRDEEQTRAKFITHPRTGERLYRTGDLGRYYPDGDIEFLGREDFQVKVQGHRIELGEIETALRAHPVVHEAVVTALGERSGAKKLVAYVVLREATSELAATAAELKAHASAALPVYMVPSAFVVLDALPLTSNGKVDRKALPAPDVTASPREAASLPRTEAERALALVWSGVLGIDVGIHDDFFELGGDSILGIQIVSRAKLAGFQVSLRQIFENPTVVDLAAVARAVQEPAAVAAASAVTGAVELTPIQRWFFEVEQPDAHTVNQARLVKLREPLEPSLLDAAWRALNVHHDALRHRFRRVGAGWQQSVELDAPSAFERVDLSDRDEEGQDQAIAIKASEAQSTLNLERGPLARMVLFDLGATRPGRLLLVIHHLVVDEVSWRILLEDLGTAYRQLRSGEPVQLPAKGTSFQAWASLLREEARQAQQLEERLAWLDRSATMRVPRDRDGDDASAARRMVLVTLGEEKTASLLREVPAVYGTQINDVLLTGLTRALSEWTGSPTVRVDVEGHGRDDVFANADVSRTVGWFTSIFPVSLAWDPRGIGESLRGVKETLRRVDRDRIAYGVLHYLVERGADASWSPPPAAEVSFNYLGQIDGSFPYPFAPALDADAPWQVPRMRRRYVLDVIGRIREGRLELGIRYSEYLHDRARVQALAEAFLGALESVVDHCLSRGAGA